MAQVMVSRVREMTEEGVTLENGQQMRKDAGMKLWRVGSEVVYTNAWLSCLDELEEGAPAIQGRFQDFQDYPEYYSFLPSSGGRDFAIPKRSLNLVNQDKSADFFLARRNRVLWAAPAPDQFPSPISKLSPDVCNLCTTPMTGEPALACNHNVHFQCLKAYVQVQKLLRCPVFNCKQLLQDNLYDQLLQ